MGESADSIDQFRDILHSSYAPGLAGALTPLIFTCDIQCRTPAALSAANHAAAESTKYLNMQEKAEVYPPYLVTQFTGVRVRASRPAEAHYDIHGVRDR